MNRKIGMYSSAVNIAAVGGFAACMPFSFDFGSYIFSMIIALSFVPMMCAYTCFSDNTRKAAGYTAVGFAAMYAAIILIVYFTQLTAVRSGGLSEQAGMILDYKRFGLFFSFDMLGYAMMSLSTFFAGLAVNVKSKADKWLKALLMIHGVFFFSCLIMPMLGLFTASADGSNSSELVGIAILEFWCLYFIPIGILSLRYFAKNSDELDYKK